MHPAAIGCGLSGVGTCDWGLALCVVAPFFGGAAARHPVFCVCVRVCMCMCVCVCVCVCVCMCTSSQTINMEDTEWDSSSSDDTTNPSPEGTSNAHSGSNFVVEVHDDMLGHCNMWTHLVVTMEPTSTSSDRANLVVYLNGQSVHSSVVR